MNTGTDLSNLYSLRKNFSIIALTGRTASGSYTIAEQIERGFGESYFPKPLESKELTNKSFRKYKIIYNFGAVNIKPYIRIFYRDVITLFLLREGFSKFIDYLKSTEPQDELLKLKKELEDKIEKGDIEKGYPESLSTDFLDIEEIVNKFENEFKLLSKEFENIDLENLREKNNGIEFYTLFFSDKFRYFSNSIHDNIKEKSSIKHHILFTLLVNNIRRSSSPYHSKETDASNIFTVADLINKVIKAIRIVKNTEPVKVLIDSLRNPFEIMFFKQRYSAFYLFAVNRDNKKREEEINHSFKHEANAMSLLFEREYKGGKGKEFFKPYIRSCIEKADVHISFKSISEIKVLNDNLKDNTSPYFSWEMQLLKFLCLIEHPGLVTPSQEERCMQLAYSAKFNSGCISRQVGAAITDTNYSIKAIGWNDVPEGQVPCLLRDVNILINSHDEEIKNELILEQKRETDNTVSIDQELFAFTPYEKTDPAFKKTLKDNFKNSITNCGDNLQGRNVCMCFKSLQNANSEGKNQVHTRSLHAEESAFLQITKYGGMPIINGKLFTTASPCELCAKKAYQLGIRVIYYVDPYPGISTEQILNVGNKKPEIRLFNGAIGSAYHWLYEPFMAYKDELALLLDQDIKDLTTKQEKRIETLEKENNNLIMELKALRNNE